MFHTNTKNGLTILTADTLSGVCHGFSTRPGGVSPAPWDSLNLGVGRGDDIARVQENYRRFCAALGTDVNRVVLSKQIHEDVVRHVTEADAGKGLWRDRDYPSVDGMVTDVLHLPLVVFSADCNAVLPYITWNGRKYHIDLKAVNALWLRKSGVTQIDVSGDCTACRTDLYWSHRKHGGERGSQIAMISLEDTL